MKLECNLSKMELNDSEICLVICGCMSCGCKKGRTSKIKSLWDDFCNNLLGKIGKCWCKCRWKWPLIDIWRPQKLFFYGPLLYFFPWLFSFWDILSSYQNLFFPFSLLSWTKHIFVMNLPLKDMKVPPEH